MITIDIRKSNKCNGDYSLYISFPYNNQIVNIMRSQIIRYWKPDSKEWEIPFKELSKVENDLKDFDYILKDDAKVLKLQNKDIIIPKDYQFKMKPFKHQLEGIEYGLKYDRFLLGDEQGLGKTMQVISIACIKKQQKNYKHCLIICGVNGLKWNWKSEVEKHSNEQAYILGTRYKKDKEYIGSMKDRLEDLEILSKSYTEINKKFTLGDLNNLSNLKNSYFLITNIETLRNEEIIKKLKELCDKCIINMLALDERS